jgi:hypothetical protein
MLTKINKLSNWQAAIIIALASFAIFWTALANPFQGDDYPQIVNNIPVHSLSNIKVFFEGGTFYNGGGSAPLTGVYFRPLMTTTFSLVYSVFGSHAIYFHLLQLLLFTGSAILFYLFLRYTIDPVLSLFLALILLAHPMNSEMVYSIPVTQDNLYFFFGMLALYILMHYRGCWSLIFTAVCLLLSLFSKETGLIFLITTAIYLYWWDRKRLLSFMGIMAIPMALYIILRIHAIGLLGTNPHTAPIDQIGLSGRLMSAPAIVLFYLSKFIFPWKLATNYFWYYPSFSVMHVIMPLIIDLIFVGAVIYGALWVRRNSTQAMYYTYLFFMIWFGLSLVEIIQIIPLDDTVTEQWFYMAMAGLLGIIGIAISLLRTRLNLKYGWVVAALIAGILGVRTCLRGLDYRNDYRLESANISASKEDYVAYIELAHDVFMQGNYQEALDYDRESINIFPSATNYSNLGVILTNEDKFPAALQAYQRSLQYGHNYVTYEDMGVLTLFAPPSAADKQYLISALRSYPKDSNLWLYLAILEARQGDNTEAKVAIQKAATYGQITPSIYSGIMDKQSFTITIAGENISIP